MDEGEFEAALAAARELALATATALRAGRIQPCPARCSRDGCAHPTICRAKVANATGQERPEADRRDQGAGLDAPRR